LATTNSGLRSVMNTSVSNTNWFINHTGSAESLFEGHIRLIDNIKHRYGTAQDAEIYYNGTDLVLDSAVVGSGVLRFGTHSAITTETLSGFITIKDSGGTTRKLAVVS